jgi:hypothetical protein
MVSVATPAVIEYRTDSLVLNLVTPWIDDVGAGEACLFTAT